MVAKTKKPKSGKSNPSKIFSDLKNELTKLETEKKIFSASLRTLQEDIKIIQDNQLKLRDKIAQLVTRETNLSSKRMRVEARISKAKDKIAKMRKIGTELEEVWE